MYKQLIFENEVLTAYTHHLMAPEHVHVNCEFVLVTNGTALNTVDGVYPLASYLYTVVVKRDLSLLSIDEIKLLSVVDDRTIRCAQIFNSLT